MSRVHNYLCQEWHEETHNLCVCDLVKDAQAAERDRIATALDKVLPAAYQTNVRVWLLSGAPA